LTTTCLDEMHWNAYDVKCLRCKEEVKESGLLDESEYNDWLEGKFTLGFNLKLEEMQFVK